MAMARWQRTIVDEAGNVAPGASITVRRAIPGLPVAAIKQDRDGLIPLANPFTADSEGFAAFHVVGGVYQITATLGAETIVWDYVGIGLAQETDGDGIIIPTTLQFSFDSSTVDADPGDGEFRLNNVDPTLATRLFVDNLNFGGATVSPRLDTFDNFGNSSSRGILEIFDPNLPSTIFHQYTVDGTVVDAGGYRRINLTWVAGQGAFTAGDEFLMTFWPQGQSSAILFDDPNPTLSADLDTNGFDIILAGGEVPMSTGRHSQWVPAGAMTSRLTNGAASVTTESSVNDVMKTTKDFDQSTSEGVQFDIAMPVSWDKNSTFTFKPYWWAAAGSGNVAWTMACRAFDNTEAIDQAFGTAQSSIQTLEATGRVQMGPESAPITPAGVQRDEPLMTFQVTRDVASDNLTADAKLIGVMIYMRIGAPNDSFGYQS